MKRRLLLSVVTLGVGFGVVEATFWALDWPAFDACDTAAPYAVADPVLGFRGDPGLPVAGVVPNGLGLRGPLPSEPKPAGEHRILFLGDSTCWGLGVALEDTFGARAAALSGPGTSYILGAFPSYSSYHSRILLERLLPLEPDVLVLYVGARNDGDRARYYPDAEIPARRARLDTHWHQLRSLRSLEAGVDKLSQLLRRLESKLDQARVPPAHFRANLDAIVQRARDEGVPALIVLPPISVKFEAKQPNARRYREMLVEAAERNSVATVSLDERFTGAAGEGPLFAPDGFHLSAEGHALAAVAIHDALLREDRARQTP